MKRFDVAIVGAGPAGSATGIALARKGFSVLLLDKRIFPREKLCGDFLNPITLPLLENLRVMEELRLLSPRKITAFRISLASGAQATSRFPAANGRPSFGLGLRRKDLDYTLLKRAVKLGAFLQEGYQVRAIERIKAVWSIAVEGKTTKERLEARLLIGADGRHSRVAHRLGLARPDGDNRGSVAFQLRLAGVRGLNNEVQIRLFPGGYAGLMALDDETANLCFTVKPEQIQRAPSVPALMKQALWKNPSLARALEPSEIVGEARSAYPVYFPPRHSHGEGVLLVGDAARVTEPVTGEGIFFALQSGALAASTAERAFERGDFSAEQLSAYRDACREAFARRQRLNSIIRALIHRPALTAVLLRLSAPTFLLRELCRDAPVWAGA